MKFLVSISQKQKKKGGDLFFVTKNDRNVLRVCEFGHLFSFHVY